MDAICIGFLALLCLLTAGLLVLCAFPEEKDKERQR